MRSPRATRLLPFVGLPLFLLIGSPYVQGRRHRIQAEANAMILDRTSDLPALPGVAATDLIAEAVKLNRSLSSLPCGRRAARTHRLGYLPLPEEAGRGEVDGRVLRVLGRGARHRHRRPHLDILKRRRPVRDWAERR